jgi:hypothetical protein
VRRVKNLANGAVYELTADWRQPLSVALDSAQAERLTPDVARHVVSGVSVASKHLQLPALRKPQVRIVGTDYDEADLPADTIPDALTHPPAEVEGVGMERRRPAATLAFNALRYDKDARRLRRYRRIRVRVTFAEDGPQQARRKQAGPRMSMTNSHLSVERSALADGLIFKFPVTESGVYRITRDALAGLLEDSDRSIGNIDPRKLQVLGNSGASLPALAGASRPAGLIENPVRVRGGGDGSFDDGDALLFYARGPQGWRYHADNNRWQHYVNSYAENNYYFLKIGQKKGARISTTSASAGSDPIREVRGRHFVEYDEFHWSPTSHGSGRTWVSSRFGVGERRALLDGASLPGRTSGRVRYRARYGLQSQQYGNEVAFEAGGEVLGRGSASITSLDHESAESGVTSFGHELSGDASLDLTAIVRAPEGGNPRAAMNWLRVFYPKRLQAQSGQLRWATPPDRSGAMTFRLSGFEEAPQVWDVTATGNVRRYETEQAGGGYRVSVTAEETEEPRELVAFTSQAVRDAPLSNVSSVDNQNLHGVQKYPDLVIVAPNVFVEQAEQLAERRRKDGLSVLVAERDKIRNEFSGGQPDMRAMRDFFKFLYDRAPKSDMLRYALLFGDGHFNYRALGGEEPAMENHLLPYETKKSYDEDDSFTSDDYFGLLSDDEGRWPYDGYSVVSDERVDIGIGRLPVQTQADADAVLKKIRQYEQLNVDSPWRLRYTFVADDGPTGASGNESDGDLHVDNAEAAVDAVRETAPYMNPQKLYGSSYEREFLSGWRIPGLHEDVMESFRQGTAVFNYSGHGGPEVLTQERIFSVQDATNLYHPNRPTLVITATCSFGRWDMSSDQSGAEELLLNPDGGAAALLTTVRLVYTSGSDTSLNAGLNAMINRKLFERTEEGRPRRLGDAMRLTKNTRVGLQGNSRKFNLLGDPTMRMAVPRYKAHVEKMNGQTIEKGDGERVSLRALQEVNVEGIVRKSNGSPASGFNGRAYFIVYDKQRQVSLPFETGMQSYTTRKDQIWRGEATVRNGRFETTFRMPKDISYSNDPGRISVYATANATNERGVDAGGYTEQVTIGGSAEDFENDGEGPQMSLFMNDSTFVSGGTVPRDARLIAKMQDSTGLNAVGAGVGHEMLLTIDGDKSNAVDLGPYFETKPNSYQEGRVTYDLEKYPAPLEPGPHSATVTAWDVANNSQTARLEFTLTDAAGGKLKLDNVFNVPNPTTATPSGSPTRFIVEHNQPSGTQADVRIRIYTLSGRPVRTLRNADMESGGLLHAGPLQIKWNGRDEDGDLLAPGVYLYKVRVAVNGNDGGKQVAERIEKLAIVR